MEQKELSDVVVNIREWKTGCEEHENFYVGETLDKNTIAINPDLYEKLEGIRYNRQDLYVLKEKID